MTAVQSSHSRRTLDRAFAENELRLVFQPRLSFDGATVAAVEGFVRWQHPSLGALPPGLFLTAFAREGLMDKVRACVFARALEAARAWRDAGYDWRVAINLGQDDLTADLAREIAVAAETYGLAPDMLVLEISEAAAAAVDGGAELLFPALRALGCELALDNVGLSAGAPELDCRHFGEIKVCGPAVLRYVARMGRRPIGGLLDRLERAHAAGAEIVAVGAEEPETITALARSGFTRVQGHAIQVPDTLDQLLLNVSAWPERLAACLVARDADPAGVVQEEPAPIPVPTPEELAAWSSPVVIAGPPSGAPRVRQAPQGSSLLSRIVPGFDRPVRAVPRKPKKRGFFGSLTKS